MKTIYPMRIVVGALVVLTCVSADAQSGDAASSPERISAPGSPSVKAENRALQKRVRRALAKAKGLGVANIAVRARDGAVLLQGSVKTQAQIDLAKEIAQNVPGVTSLTSALTIGGYGQ